MPYVKQERRPDLDNAIDEAMHRLRLLHPSKGDMNYVVTRIVANCMRPMSGWTYTTLSEAIDTLHDAEAEMRRRLLDPYEDKAKELNGDIPEYEQP